MSELNDYRDHAWYIQQSHQAADRALLDNDETEALKYRTIALDVMMRPIVRMRAVNDVSISRYVDYSRYDASHDIHKHIGLIRELAVAVERLGEHNEASLKIIREIDETQEREIGVLAGDIRLEHQTSKDMNGYTSNIVVLARSSLRAARWVQKPDSAMLMSAQYAALPEMIEVRPVVAPPSAYRLIADGPSTERAFTSDM